ncbi:MAG TPA: PD-(D/E)XK nuclease family protein [Thermoanaerobaculia bacterium]|nr:PD-(D/E)XK nuclease family protein [Thermoanaerobaculia bacterium]
MLPFLRFGRYREIAREVAERLLNARDATAPRSAFAAWRAGLDVIVPSASMADSIVREILAHVPEGIAGLRIDTIERLARRIVNDAGEYPHVADDRERRLAMRTAVRAVDDPMMATHGIGSMIERSYRDVRDSGMTLDRFEQRLRTANVRHRRRSQAILAVWREYERLLTRLSAIDPADLFERASALIERLPADTSFLVAGFYDMTGVQLALVSALAARERLGGLLVPVAPPVSLNGESYRFAEPFINKLTSFAQAEASDSPPHSPDWHASEHDTNSAELRAVCRAIRDLLQQGARPESIGIVARSLDPYDVRLLDRFSRENGFTVSARASSPLIGQRIARGVVTLLRLRDRSFPRGDVLELVRDGLRTRPVHIDRVDLSTRNARIAGGTSTELGTIKPRRADEQGVRDYLGVLAELEELTQPLRGPLTGGEWSELLTRFTALFTIETEADLAAAAELDRIADLFRRANVFDTRFEIATAIDVMERSEIEGRDARDEGRETRDEGQGTRDEKNLGGATGLSSLVPRPSSLETSLVPRPNVFLGDVMTLRGRSFDHLFAIRMQDDVFPQRRVEDPLLPDFDRRQFGIREIGNGRDEEQLLFRLLFDAAGSSLRFSFAGTDGFGKLLRPSQLLKNFVLAEDPARKSDVLHDFSKYLKRRFLTAPEPAPAPAPDPRLTRQLQLIARAGTRSVFDGYLFATPGSDDEALRGRLLSALGRLSPTHLEDFGECPQKFLFKHALGVTDIDDPEREIQINHRDKGSLDHRILERFYSATSHAEIDQTATLLPRLGDVLGQRLETVVDEELDRHAIESPPFNRNMREIERRATKRNLRDFAASDLADILASGLYPASFEYRFGSRYAERANHPEPFIIHAHDLPIRVEGTIDRIDEGRGRYRIVDYKSGKATRHQNLGVKIDRGVRLQLALYAMAVAEFFAVDPATVDAAIKPLVAGEIKPVKFQFNLAEKRARLAETLEIFVAAIAGGIFPAFPNENDEDFNSCKYCPMKLSCRTKHDPDEKYAVVQSKEPRSLLAGAGDGHVEAEA